MFKVFFLFLLLLTSTLGFSQQNFDFWLGEWDVFSSHSGKKYGTNKVTKILDGKIIHEEWTSVTDFKGQSFTLYDSIDGYWHQTWVDNTGTQTNFFGILKKDTIQFLTHPQLNKEKKIAVERMRIVKINDNELIQIGEISFDNTQTWNESYNLTYKKDQNKAMHLLLAQDSIYSKARNDCSKISLSENILKYCKALESMNYWGSGENFKIGFQKHIQAWYDLIPLADNYSKLRGNIQKLFSQIEKGTEGEFFKQKVANILSTWEIIENEIKK